MHVRADQLAKYLLELERGGGSAPGLKVSLERLRALAEGEAAHGGGVLLKDAAFHSRLTELEVAVRAIDMTEKRVLSALADGRNPGPASSMLKTQGTEAMQRIDELALDAAAHYAAPFQPQVRAPGANAAPVGPEHSLTASARYLNNRAGSEISVTTIGEWLKLDKHWSQWCRTRAREGSELIVEALVLNRDAGLVKPGDPVVVKVEAYPFTRYGALPAVLEHVSADAVVDERRGLVFPARVRLRGTALTVNGRPAPLTPGMSTVAEIVTGERRVIDHLWSPMQRATSEAGRER